MSSCLHTFFCVVLKHVSALEALRNALYEFSTYLLTYFCCVHLSCVCVCVVVCRGRSSGLTHHKNIDAMYRQYLTDWTGCTYVDGNIEIVFLTNQTNYDLSFLKVRSTLNSFHISTSRTAATSVCLSVCPLAYLRNDTTKFSAVVS